MRRLLLLLVLAGCTERDPRWSDTSIIDGPLEVAGKLGFVSRGTNLLVALDPSTGAARATPLVERVRAVGHTANEVLVIGGDGQAPRLQILGPDGAHAREVPLPGAYDRIEVAPDGLHAIALYDPLATPAPGAPAARNANEVVVIDVVAGTVRREVLETESLAPRAVVFAAGGDRAAVLLDTAVALIDLSRGARALRVPLELPGGARLTPERALFSPDGAFLYVQTAGASDVLALQIAQVGDRLTASINFLSVSGGGRVRDIAIAGTGAALAGSVAVLFEAGGQSLAALLDATGDTSKSHIAAIDAPLGRLEVLGEGLLLVHGSPAQRASAGSAYLAGWEPLLDRVDLTQLSGPTTGPLHVGAGGVAFFEHRPAEGSMEVAITAMRIETGGAELRARSSPVLIGGQLTALAADRARGEIYLGVTVARRDSGAAPTESSDDDFEGVTGSLVVVRADGLDIVGVPLDEVVTAVGLIGDVVYAAHPAEAGDLTFLPRNDLRRESARRSDGFLLTGLFDVEAP